VQVVQQVGIIPQADRVEILCLLQPLLLVAHVAGIKEPTVQQEVPVVVLDVIKAQALVQVQEHQVKVMQEVHPVAHNLLDQAVVVEHRSQGFKGLVTATAAMNAAVTVAMDHRQELLVLP
jgi:hypothetical protein